MSKNLEHLLLESLHREGVYWTNGDSGPARWEAMARHDPVGAALAASVEREEAKSRPGIELLLTEVTSGVLLDIGCGYGRLAKYLLREVALDGYIGIDGSPTMLKLFHERHCANQDERRTPLLLIQAQLPAVALVDECVDNVVISAVLLHNPKRIAKRVIDEAWRVLKPGGKLVLLGEFPNRLTPAGVQGEAYLFLLRLLGRGDENGPIRYGGVGKLVEK